MSLKRFHCRGAACRSSGAAIGRLLFMAELTPGSRVEIKCPDSRCKTLNKISGPPAPDSQVVVVQQGVKLVDDGVGGFKEVPRRSD